MRIIVLVLSGCCFFAGSLRAEKPSLQVKTGEQWAVVTQAAISNDGRYAAYGMRNGSAVDAQDKGKTILKSLHDDWKMELTNAGNVQIAENSRHFVFTKGDQLGIGILGSMSVEYISQVGSFRLPRTGNGEWLCYQLGTPDKTVVVRNLNTKFQRSFSGVSRHVITEDGLSMVMSKGLEDKTESLSWVTFADGRATEIWRGAKSGRVMFDRTGKQLAFMASRSADAKRSDSLWLYRQGETEAIELIGSESIPLEKVLANGLKLNDVTRFSRDGARLFFTVQELAPPVAGPEAVPLNVWSYTDPSLQSYQLKNKTLQSYAMSMDLQARKVSRLEGENEWISSGSDDFAIITLDNRAGANLDLSEQRWNRLINQPPVYLLSLADGSRKPLAHLLSPGSRMMDISPGGKFIIYYRGDDKNYFCYELATGVTRNITQGAATQWSYYGHTPTGGRVDGYLRALPPAGWLQDDAAVLLYDQNDIWQADPTGKQAPINLTGGYGGRNNIEFRFALERRNNPFKARERLLLTAYNRDTKENGFFRAVLGKSADPERLTMGPYMYHAPDIRIDIHGRAPVKARDAEMYLVQRMSSTESPNYFTTRDFKTFTPLSDVRPEKSYNWVTTELHRFAKLDGNPAQGVLFKPENFDPKKKYPVIFYYYEVVSDYLNAYVMPEPLSNGCSMNIPLFVSNGYLVFTPDIHYTFGQPGKSALNSVAAAAEYMKSLPYVDGAKMGIQGCSFGSIQTNYIVTHTDMFAAACSVSGISNFISGHGSLDGENGKSNQGMYETGQMRMNATLWERPDLYIENSALMRADKVVTPLLLMHTTKDIRCLFSDAIEFFTSLRRLGKTSWMLEYEDGNHGISGKSAVDFSIRMLQFFDHYLKGASPAKWMTEGVQARMKGIETGLELDRSGKAPGPGLLMTN